MIDEGYIKFTCDWHVDDPPAAESIAELNRWRDTLYEQGLIGAYPDGIGFGNLSVRLADSKQFVITGTQTGNIPRLTAEHYTTVTFFDIAKNKLSCIGPAKASSESLTHAAAYETSLEIGAVFHVHSRKLWDSWKGKIPTTDETVPYGTPEMAYELQRLIREGQSQLIVMGGHEEGLIAYGQTADVAGQALLRRC